MKLIFTVALIIFNYLSVIAQTPNLQWATSYGGSGSTQLARDITYGPDGHIYTIGSFAGPCNFDGQNISSNGQHDIFIIKSTPNGDMVWVKTFGSSGSDIGHTITVSESGIIISGSFSETVNFGDYTLTSNGAKDIYVCNINTCGEVEWAKHMGGIYDDLGQGLYVDENQNVYTTGYFKGTADLDPSDADYNVSSAGGRDIFISKLDSNGDFVWGHKIGSSGSDEARDITGSNGYIYITGGFSNTVDFNVYSGSNTLSSSGSTDIFIAKLSQADASYVWATKAGYGSDDMAQAIDIDYNNNLVISGHVRVSHHDVFVGKYNDANGSVIWTKRFGGSGIESGVDLTADSNGNIITTGYFNSGSIDFDPGTGSDTHTNNSSYYDMFVQAMDENGNYLWGNNMGSNLDESGYAITSIEENIYAAGYFNATAEYTLGSNTEYLSSNGGYDISIIKIGPDCTAQFNLDQTNLAVISDCMDVNHVCYGGVIETPTASNSCGEVVLGTTATNFPITSAGTTTITWTFNLSNGSTLTQTQDVTISLPNYDLTVDSNNGILSSNQDNVQYQWIDCASGDPIEGATEQSYTPSISGEYAVILSTGNNCDETSECVTYVMPVDPVDPVDPIDPEEPFFIPNIITQNGDQLNDTFHVKGIEGENWTLHIYNRWGKLIYENSSYNNSWNGNTHPEGTYYYIISNNDDTTEKYNGWVLLMRN